MQAVILAAGKGKRLYPLTQDLPKGMLPLNGKPLLQIIIEQLRAVGVTDIIIIVNYCKERIVDFFSDGTSLGVNLTYVHQPEMKGTADAVLQAESAVASDKFICIACDSLFEHDLLFRILSHPTEGVITCKEVSDHRRYGMLKVENLKVLEIVEKPEIPPSNLANFSVYIFPKQIFPACRKVKPSPRGEFEINDAIKILINQGYNFTYEISTHVIDIGTFEQLSQAEAVAKELGL